MIVCPTFGASLALPNEVCPVADGLLVVAMGVRHSYLTLPGPAAPACRTLPQNASASYRGASIPLLTNTTFRKIFQVVKPDWSKLAMSNFFTPVASYDGLQPRELHRDKLAHADAPISTLADHHENLRFIGTHRQDHVPAWL